MTSSIGAPRKPSEPVPVTFWRSAAGLCRGAQLHGHAARVQLARPVRRPERTPRQGHRAHVHGTAA